MLYRFTAWAFVILVLFSSVGCEQPDEASSTSRGSIRLGSGQYSFQEDRFSQLTPDLELTVAKRYFLNLDAYVLKAGDIKDKTNRVVAQRSPLPEGSYELTVVLADYNQKSALSRYRGQVEVQGGQISHSFELPIQIHDYVRFYAKNWLIIQLRDPSGQLKDLNIQGLFNYSRGVQPVIAQKALSSEEVDRLVAMVEKPTWTVSSVDYEEMYSNYFGIQSMPLPEDDEPREVQTPLFKILQVHDFEPGQDPEETQMSFEVTKLSEGRHGHMKFDDGSHKYAGNLGFHSPFGGASVDTYYGVEGHEGYNERLRKKASHWINLAQYQYTVHFKAEVVYCVALVRNLQEQIKCHDESRTVDLKENFYFLMSIPPRGRPALDINGTNRWSKVIRGQRAYEMFRKSLFDQSQTQGYKEQIEGTFNKFQLGDLVSTLPEVTKSNGKVMSVDELFQKAVSNYEAKIPPTLDGSIPSLIVGEPISRNL